MDHAFENADYVLYMTHDHFKVAPSKLNLIKLAANMTKQYSNVKKTVFLTPSEYDHMGEIVTPLKAALDSEKQALDTCGDKSVLIRADITFGIYSQ